MTLINLPQDQQRAIKAVDVRSLEAAVDKCLREEQVGPVYELGLRECGDYVPDYAQLLSKRKPSAAKAASDQQDKLYREWEYLKMQALCSMREFFRDGGDGIDIPKSFAVRPSQYGGGLNNFSCNFWQPA
ncbi:hypothetical protein AA303_14690 [Pseudomonas psychrophila]|uniref:hypothetical protein n=1 Tax=Pseudomonas psychrophila TaxID=122355 RepID=UPI00062A12D3|nr:hypothetical protein [Pseudomonas psychrophila]KOX64352.1 hypothetical protein AA303_14690 [Pseudomonas psychrophila]